jgi:hypothetical protein
VRDLNYQLKQICRRNRDGSYSTQAKRFHHLMMMANQLHDLGFHGMKPRSLKPKHVDALVKHWMQQELERIGDPYVRMSLELQQAFGLRREEAIKFSPDYADCGDHIRLKPSWTKGGKERVIPVRTDRQREVLQRAHQLAGKRALIPVDMNYVQQLRVYERLTANAGLSKMHGLRHAYAQARYEELTGWKAPAAGGPVSKSLSPGQKVMDRHARTTVSHELGHIRLQISGVYLGN